MLFMSLELRFGGCDDVRIGRGDKGRAREMFGGPVPIVHFEGIAISSFTGTKFFRNAVFDS